jgi:hypothetical protein
MQILIGNILTSNGKNMLTAVNGGGLGGPDSGTGLVALHTDATSASTWETYKLILQPGSAPVGPGMKFALQTSSGTNYLTAVNGGGIGGPNDATCPVHTDATTGGAWEVFTLTINDSVNPPTVTLSPFNVVPLAGSCFVTAVNGGGVGGPNTQPIHTDATSVGTWQLFSFAPLVAVPQNSIQIQFNTNINGPANGNIAGAITLTMSSDGLYSFSGKMNNSNWFPYDMTAGLVVVSSKGTALTFSATGTIDAALPWDNNNWTWNNTGNNSTIQSIWADLEAGYTWYYDVSASLDLGSLMNGILNAIKAAGTVVQAIVAVVGALS